MIRKAGWLAAIVFVAIACMHLEDTAARDAAVRQFLADPNRGISRIVERYGVDRQCPDRNADRFQPVAAALVTVETLATPRFEGWARAATAYLATLLQIKVDF